MWDHTTLQILQDTDLLEDNILSHTGLKKNLMDLPVSARLHDTLSVSRSLKKCIEKNKASQNMQSPLHSDFAALNTRHMQKILKRIDRHIERLMWCERVIKGLQHVSSEDEAWHKIMAVLDAPDPVLEVDHALADGPHWHLQFFQPRDNKLIEKSTKQVNRLRILCGVD